MRPINGALDKSIASSAAGATAWFEAERRRFADHPPFLWDGILEAGGISIIAGKKGHGKSTFARTLALSIARGTDVLGRRTTRSPVWFLDFEPGGPGRIKVWRDLGWCNADELYLNTMSPVAGRDGVFDWLRQHIIEYGYRLVVIDTMFRLLRIEGANEYDAGLYAQVPLEELCRETGVHFMLVHHARKKSIDEAQLVAEAILGATSIAGAACACMLIQHHGRNFYTFRMDPPRYGHAIDGEIVLQKDVLTGAIYGGEKWQRQQTSAAKEAIRKQAGELVLFTASDIDPPIDARTGKQMTRQVIHWALRALVTEGWLEQHEVTAPRASRGRPSTQYRVAQTDEFVK
jgi:hypothetical protein